MNKQDSTKLKQARSYIVRTAISVIALWTLLLSVSLYWNLDSIDQQSLHHATSDAKAHWNKDQAFRQWATAHGGVYVRIDERTQPSPYLSNLPNRDIETSDGTKLTLMNPAFMMRQMIQEFTPLYGIKGKVTSELQINPKNAPDAWELKALQSFKQGKQEIVEQTELDGESYIRLMRPMKFTDKCVECHVQLQDVPDSFLGGVSISIPLAPYFHAAESIKQSVIASHGLLWIMGLLGTTFIARRNYGHEQDRQKTEAQLEQSEQEWHYAMDFFQDAVFLINLDKTVIRANRAFYQLTNLDEKQVIGTDISTIIHPQGEATPCQICKAIDTRVDTMITLEADDPANSTGRPIEIQVRPIHNHDGETTGILMAMHDLSRSREAEAAVRESEHQIRDLLESTAEAIYSLDFDGTCTLANRACADLLGYDNPNQLVGRKLHNIIHHSHEDGRPYPVEDCPIHSATRIGRPDHRDNEVFWRRDGSSFPVEYWAYPIYREDKLVGAVATFFDISERKQTEQILRHSQKMDALGQLTGGIAHDFNNQLGVVIGYLDFLSDFLGQDDKSRRWVDNATKATNRCIDLTRQLLAFSRKQQTDLEYVDLKATLEDIKELIERSVTPVVSVNFTIADDTWPLMTSPGDLQDAILNLAINARDAMPEGGHLDISIANVHMPQQQYKDYEMAEDDYVLITMKDNGFGMAPNIMEHVFDPFYTTKEVGKGTGLGLSMVYGYVKRNSGYIHLESELGEGTIVRLYLPAYKDDQKVTRMDNGSSQLPHGRGETILLVEDEEYLGTLAEELLSDRGYRIINVQDGIHAIDVLSKNRDIDLLFSDVVMPGGISGFELAKQARTIKPDIKILLTSGYAFKEHEKAELEQLYNMLDKPYTKSQLLQAIDKTLNSTG